MARKKVTNDTTIETLKHKDKRVNIPTKELRDFVSEYEARPKTVLYPRDPSLDPQLVWKGKDEQDAQDLAVPAVPVYIQEKIHPMAIVENIRAEAKKEKSEEQFSLFADFNGIEFEEMIDFYHHEQNWTNRMILGDSLLVMNSLAEKEGLKGKVQMIYLDPPYGIKFGSNWQVSTRRRDVKDGKAEDLTRQPEQVRAFRDTWQLGIHSYLSYLRDRLMIARELLSETGSVFVQIGDENVHLVRCLLDEVFGSENFISLISLQKTSGFSPILISNVVDYLLWYAKAIPLVKYRATYLEKVQGQEGATQYNFLEEDQSGQIRPLKDDEKIKSSLDSSEYKLLTHGDLSAQGLSSSPEQPFRWKSNNFSLPANSHWKTTSEGLARLSNSNRLMAVGNSLRYKRYMADFPVFPINNIWTDTSISGFSDKKIYVVQTNPLIIQRCLLMTTDPGDLVLDPTCGSGTTAYVSEQWGRRWITIDTSRVALALARTRLMVAKYPYYLLTDSEEGIIKEAELTSKIPPFYKTEGDIKKGFVYKRVPHVTLKSIANNEEIDSIHNRYQEKLEPLRNQLNKHLKQSWEEWQVPREPEEKWSQKAKELHKEWWKLRLERQKEIDVSIARHADTEILYDQSYENNKWIRVTGPFTMESLSPHRVLDPTLGVVAGLQPAPTNDPSQFVHMILENLKKAGVQNRIKQERLKFERLEPYAGIWIQAEGEYTESDGKIRRAAVCIGPEHGTVGPQLVKEAAKEAVQGIGFNLLVVCGFAFDPHVSEEAKRYGKLAVLMTRMNHDLTMGDELLKKTGAGNLFMVFGEPDIKINKEKDGKFTVEIIGVDVYDPTTGQLRSSSTDDIACWFMDTDYNGESFFVRHAYFTGADEPYEKLKRALRAHVDESAWSSLYSTKSRSFPRPKSNKIAIKVINHYGDEVLKVCAI